MASIAWRYTGPIVGYGRIRHAAYAVITSDQAAKIAATTPRTSPGRRVPAYSRMYHDHRTQGGMDLMRAQWVAAGRPKLPEGVPFTLDLVIVVARPASHYLKSGELSTRGRVAGMIPPRKKPDVDNVVKLVLDALAQRKDRRTGELIDGAWDDDARLGLLRVERRYQVNRGEREGIEISAEPLEVAPL